MSIQVDAKTQKITHRDEGVGLLKLVKLWKLLLVSLWLLMTIHLLKEQNGNTDYIFPSCLNIYIFFIASLIFPAQFILACARIAIGKISCWLFKK